MHRVFEMVRKEDESGVSGTGKVLEGVVFSDGTCAVRWVAATSPGRCTAFFDSLGAFIAVHVATHPDNKTRLIFSDGEIYEHTTSIKPEASADTKPVRKVGRPRKNKVLGVGVSEGQI